MIHHRVDFAASMVDGRTVGEVTAKSASAKEIRELWIYIQGRLARLKHDAAFAPAFVPQNFAVAALSSADASEPVAAGDCISQLSVPAPPPLLMQEAFTGGERRSDPDRRRTASEPPYSFGSRRSQPFGRRSTDYSY
jgi:chromosome partitioning protein